MQESPKVESRDTSFKAKDREVGHYNDIYAGNAGTDGWEDLVKKPEPNDYGYSADEGQDEGAFPVAESTEEMPAWAKTAEAKKRGGWDRSAEEKSEVEEAGEEPSE